MLPRDRVCMKGVAALAFAVLGGHSHRPLLLLLLLKEWRTLRGWLGSPKCELRDSTTAVPAMLL